MAANLDSAFEKLSKSAAHDLVKNSSILGLGSGSAVATFARALGDRAKKESLEIRVIPSSMQAWFLATMNGLKFAEDSAHCPARIDLAVDGADQISLETRAMIKGGGGALLKEKVIISAAKECYILADETKFVPSLIRPVPVEVTQFSAISVEEKIKSLGAEPVMRKLEKGYPFFTESGNVILDCKFKGGITESVKLEKEIKSIPGVVEAGIFNFPVKKFYKANQDGTFDVL